MTFLHWAWARLFLLCLSNAAQFILATYDKLEEGVELAGLEHWGDEQKGGEEGGNEFPLWQQSMIIEHALYNN
jgi:hypothetical protein